MSEAMSNEDYTMLTFAELKAEGIVLGRRQRNNSPMGFLAICAEGVLTFVVSVDQLQGLAEDDNRCGGEQHGGNGGDQ
jgi:hypothetical protein